MQIIRRLESLRHREHTATVELIEALCTCHRTRAYADAGYGSIWQLLVRRLHYSPAAASRRNAAMRCALRFPVVLDMLRAHRTTLSALHKIEKTLLDSSEPDVVLRQLDGATQEDVERIVAATRPVARVKERVRNVVVNETGLTPRARRGGAVVDLVPWEERPASSFAAELPSINRSTDERSAAERPLIDPSHDERSPATRVEERVQLTFSLSRSDFAKLQRLKSKLSHKLPTGMTLEQVFVLLMDERLEEPKPRAHSAAEVKPNADSIEESKPTFPRTVETTSPRSRHIPAATRRAVFARDGRRCTFVAPDGTRCTSTHALEVDHVLSFAAVRHARTREPPRLVPHAQSTPRGSRVRATSAAERTADRMITADRTSRRAARRRSGARPPGPDPRTKTRPGKTGAGSRKARAKC